MFLFLLYSLIAHALRVQLSPRVLLCLEGMVVISGIVSVFHFVWQHRIEVFVKDKLPEGGNTIALKKTEMIDLIKIFLLGLLMASLEISMSIGGYFLGEPFQLTTSSRVLLSCGFCFLGFLLASISHFIWNYCPGTLG